MSSSGQPLPRGWLQHQRTVEKLLLSTKERNLVSALYLHGPPTSGLNTSLVDYVVQQAKAGLAPRRVVYITGTELDKECAASRSSIWEPMGNNDYTSLLTIKDAKEFCDENLGDKVVIDDDLVLMIDVRMSSTVAEEIMFGMVLEQLQNALRRKKDGAKVSIAILLLGSSWFSDRTFKSFEKLMQTAKRPIRDTYPPVKFSSPSPNELNRIIGETLKKGQRLMISSDKSWNMFSVFDEIVNYRDNSGNMLHTPCVPGEGRVSDDLRNVRRSLCFQVDPHILFSAPTDVSTILSRDHVTSEIFDPIVSQVVQVQRQLTRCELETVHAWEQKATKPVRLFTNYGPGILNELKDGDETLGPAWSKDLTFLVLRTFHILGGQGYRPVRRFPIRVPANHTAWADRCRRLMVLVCLTEEFHIPGTYYLTDRGTAMSQLVWKNNLDWEVAWLLMSARSHDARPDLDDVCCYIIACMAAIIACGPRSFVAKTGALKSDGSPYALKDLEALCSPCLRRCASHGMLWLYTGIFLARMNAMVDSSLSAAETTQPDSYLVISFSRGVMIKDLLTSTFLPLSHLGEPRNRYFMDTPLTDKQVAAINSTLMWAFLHRTVYFEKESRDAALRGLPEDTILGRDCVSLHEIRIEQDREFLDVERWRAHGNRTRQGGGFYAIYNQLERRSDQDGTYYIAKGLTRLPPTIFQEAESRNKMPWPEMVLSCLD